MGAGAFIEPLVIISLLTGGTWVNRTKHGDTFGPNNHHKRVDGRSHSSSESSNRSSEDGPLSSSSRSSSPGYLSQDGGEWRRRTIHILGWNKEVHTPNTAKFSNRTLSRLLQRFPFLVEAWYWALIYWVYQLGRAFTAVTLVEGTVHTAREHALQLIRFEQKLSIFWEPSIQQYFLQYPTLMHWINRIYSFIHIPGTILFLIWVYHLTITSNFHGSMSLGISPAGPALYQARRRTMAMCNLLAFGVFTIWPCMPPRLLSDPGYNGLQAYLAKSYGFVDTVHGPEGESSVWTTNRFCNQYAAMPSLHFGYSLLIGVSIATIPLDTGRGRTSILSFGALRVKVSVPAWKRLACSTLGIAYPAVILVAIVTTANHFILDAVAGAFVCAIAWRAEGLLLNLLPLEDWFLWFLRMYKPEFDRWREIQDEKVGLGRVLPM